MPNSKQITNIKFQTPLQIYNYKITQIIDINTVNDT